MKHRQRMSLKWLCHRFKTNPHYLEWLLKDCILDVEACVYKCDAFKGTVIVEVNNLDDVVQCILEYKEDL